MLIDIVGRTQKGLRPFECVVLHVIKRGRCICALIDQKLEVQCFWIIGPAHLVPMHNQGGVTGWRNEVGWWQGKRGDGAESTDSRCIFSRPFENGFNSSCVSTINCTCVSASSGLVRYTIAALLCCLLDEEKKKGGGGWRMGRGMTVGVTRHLQ